MAAFVPNRAGEVATHQALTQVRADKDREAADGFDGSWVAHPGLVQTSATAFDAVLGDRPDQRKRLREDVSVRPADLLAIGAGGAGVSLDGVLTNISVTMRYLAAWVGGAGAVAIENVMEDAATVEISRAQLWQWIRNGTRLVEGPKVSREMVESMIAEQTEAMIPDGSWGTREQVSAAREVLSEASLGEHLPGFFTPYAYVRYLTEKPLRMTGPLTQKDLRMSEQMPAIIGCAATDAAADATGSERAA